MMLVVNQVTFKQEVSNSPVPVLVSFWAPWCGVCQMVDPMLSELQAQWGAELKVVSVNADENLFLTSTHRIKTLPTVLLFDRGSVLHRVERFSSRDDFRNALVDFHQALENVSVSEYSYSA
jgi:thioredoxin 1